MSKEKEIAEENDQTSLNSDAVQESPELTENETKETTDTTNVTTATETEETEVSNEPEEPIEEPVENTTESVEAEQTSDTPVADSVESEEAQSDDPSAAPDTPDINASSSDEAPESAGTSPDVGESTPTPTDTSEPESEVSETTPTAEVATDQQANDSTAGDETELHEDSQGLTEEEHEEDEDVDYTTMSKEELLDAVAHISNNFNIKRANRALNDIKPVYDNLSQAEKEAALQQFTADGGEEADFDFKGNEADVKIEEYFKIIREKRGRFYHDLEKQKDVNLNLKTELLEQLRELVHGEENTTSINALKEIQNKWRSTGPVHQQHNKTLWANYHALINQFYDQRSIYFELKELDRKKNLEAKIDICKRAEELNELENFNDAVKKLNELHDEYKHVGPVPREQQEELWIRFKTASDNIYAKRKEFVASLKETLHQNLEKKLALTDRLNEFVNFNSDRITEWNKRTKEILALQKEWESIGSMPKEKAKEVNKKFWGAFKTFFHHKSEFFKTLESQREGNLKLKQELVDKANALKDSEDWNGTANELKQLQRAWKDIGPVPDKDREPIYQAFKEACDSFFTRRREHSKELESSYEDNLKQKEDICAALEKIADSGKVDPDKIYELQDSYNAIGFVPKKAIKGIQRRYKAAIDLVLQNADNLDDETRSELTSLVKLHHLKSGPHSDQKIHRQEHALKRKINHLENDISTWKNNMGFFANSKNADELMKDFNKKIEKAEEQLQSLKDELRLISNLD